MAGQNSLSLWERARERVIQALGSLSSALSCCSGRGSITALVLTLACTPAAMAQSDSELPIGHFYTQANGGAPAEYGFRVSNEGGIGFWSDFQRLGGVASLGYPISRRFMLDGYVSQATQKV